PKLATFAQEWADELKRRGCDLKHRPRQGGFSQRYGENLYWGSAVLFADGRRRSASTTTLEKVILGWASERAFYDANNHTCASGKACGHYTQIVWSATKRVGCGWAKCEDLSQVWVCNYDPPGNVLGRRPF
ncbi:MAG: CAP domain-containing protein, partial [Myxococcota bacterium]